MVTQAAPLMVNVSSFAAASYKKKLYVIGGGPNGKLATDKTQCYDPANNTWSLKAPMPVEAKCINAASFRDHIYVVGRWSINVVSCPDTPGLVSACWLYPQTLWSVIKWSDDLPLSLPRMGIWYIYKP